MAPSPCSKLALFFWPVSPFHIRSYEVGFAHRLRAVFQADSSTRQRAAKRQGLGRKRPYLGNIDVLAINVCCGANSSLVDLQCLDLDSFAASDVFGLSEH